MDDPNILPLDALVRTAELETTNAAWHEGLDCLHNVHDAYNAHIHQLSCQLQETQDQLARVTKQAALSEITGQVVHRLQNTIAPLVTYVDLARRRASDDPTTVGIIVKVQHALASLDSLLADLAQLTSNREPAPTRLSPAALFDEVCATLETTLATRGIRVQLDVSPRLQITADREMLRRAVTNLVTNAIQAMPDGGELVVTAYEGTHGIELEVADSGPGLLGELRHRAFEPLFTTKTDGTGLGLAIVRRVAEAHGGDVTAENCPEGGAAFTIRIPRVAMKAAA
jgi:signal transduction histidine kinase